MSRKMLDNEHSWYGQDREVRQVWLIKGSLICVRVVYVNDDRSRSRAWAYSLEIAEGEPIAIVETAQCHWWLKVSTRPVPLNSPKELGEEAAIDIMREVAYELARRVDVIYTAAMEYHSKPEGPSLIGAPDRPEGPGDVSGRIGR